MISTALRRWRALRPRWRRALVLLASVSLLGGAWLGFPRRPDDWPAKVALTGGGVTVPLAFSPDGGSFATASGGRIDLWDASDGRGRATWTYPTDRFAQQGAFSPDGRTFAAAMSRYPRPMEVELIDVASGRVRATLGARLTNVFALRFRPDGGSVVLFSASTGGLAEVLTWDVATGSLSSSRPVPALKAPGHYLAASGDGRFLVSVQPPGGTVRLWDLEADDPNPTPLGAFSSGEVSAAAFSADGRAVAIGRGDGVVEVWDVASRRRLRTLDAHPGGYGSVGIEFAPDGRSIASRGQPGEGSGLARLLRDLGLIGDRGRPSIEMVVLDLESGRRLSGSRTSFHPLFSPDGRTVASREFDGRVRLRELPGGGP